MEIDVGGKVYTGRKLALMFIGAPAAAAVLFLVGCPLLVRAAGLAPDQRAQAIRDRGPRLTQDEQRAMLYVDMVLNHSGIEHDHRAVVEEILRRSRKDGIPINQAFDQVFPISAEQQARMDWYYRSQLDELRAMRLD
jgi:hypothetical protein